MLLFCCFFIFLHENLHPGQGEPNSRTLPPCPKEKLCNLLFSYCFQFGESFTRGERLENLSLMKMKDWATQNTRRCAFQRGYSLICDYNCYGISNKYSFLSYETCKIFVKKNNPKFILATTGLPVWTRLDGYKFFSIKLEICQN